MGTLHKTLLSDSKSFNAPRPTAVIQSTWTANESATIRNVENDERAKTIANELLKMARDLPYANIGTVSGTPKGVLLRVQTLVRDGLTFIATTTVRSIDQPFDGVAGGIPDDVAPEDSKLVEIDVTCVSCASHHPVLVSTTIDEPRPTSLLVCQSDTASCGAWSACSTSGKQTRSCVLAYGCPEPITSQSCIPPVTIPSIEYKAVSVQVKGQGVITTTPEGINCGNGQSQCTAKFPEGTSLTWHETPSPGWYYQKQEGNCWNGYTCTKIFVQSQASTANRNAGMCDFAQPKETGQYAIDLYYAKQYSRAYIDCLRSHNLISNSQYADLLRDYNSQYYGR